jgi:AcrR family transcriptional regulator
VGRYSEKRREAIEATLREEVFEVASAILRKEGPEGLTMDHIARRVGVSRGTLYNYFADADAVVNYVEARTVEPVVDRMDEIVRSSDPAPRKLQAIARAVFDSLNEDRALALALFAKQETRGPRAEQKKRRRKLFLDQVQAVLVSGVEEGSLRDVPPPLTAEIFLGAVTGLIETMVYSGEFRTADELVPGLMDVLGAGIASG